VIPITSGTVCPAPGYLRRLYFRADVRGCTAYQRQAGAASGQPQWGQRPTRHVRVHVGVLLLLGVERPFFQLAHNMVVSAPGLGWLRKFGTVAANSENARMALESGHASALLSTRVAIMKLHDVLAA